MTKRLFFVLTLILVLGFGFQNAQATPILGQPVYYEGGSVEVTVLAADAYFTSNLYLFSTISPLFIAVSSDVGKVVTLSNLPSLGVAVGDELLFGIIVNNTGDKFVTGPASRNPDNFAHAIIDYFDTPTGDVALFGFEDLWGGGDKDFNDANFLASGGIGVVTPRIPEPASMVLLFFGLAGVAWVSARKKTHSIRLSPYTATSQPYPH
jgi:hypothetical protein